MSQSLSNALGSLTVSGPDAKKFLQGQLTCNLDDLTPNQSLFGAHCNPQGRVLSFFRILNNADHYNLVMHQSMVNDALKYLKKYAVFFKVELSIEPEPSSIEAVKKYFDIHQNIPHIYPSTSGKFLPHELGLHKIEALSFNKGCFTGQEIIARMHYKGQGKNHLYLAKIKTSTPLEAGQELFTQKSNDFAGYIVDFTSESTTEHFVLVITSITNRQQPLHTKTNQDENWTWLQ